MKSYRRGCRFPYSAWISRLILRGFDLVAGGGDWRNVIELHAVRVAARPNQDHEPLGPPAPAAQFLVCLFLSLGVVAFWLGLAVAITTISGFNAANQLFHPAFTIIVGLVICAMAIGMCGFFSVRLPNWIYSINPSEESLTRLFGFGVMTAVLSTPCTAPLMGAAAACHHAITRDHAEHIWRDRRRHGVSLPAVVRLPGLVETDAAGRSSSELIAGHGTSGCSGRILSRHRHHRNFGEASDPAFGDLLVVRGSVRGRCRRMVDLANLANHSKPGRRLLFGGFGLLLIAGSLAGGARRPAAARSIGPTIPGAPG